MKRLFIIGSIVILSMCFGLTACGGDGRDELAESVNADLDAKGQKKAFVAGVATETNLFCPFPTDLNDFSKSKEGFPAFTKNAKERGWDVTYGVIANAMPAGITTRSAYETLKAELLSDLKAALPVDMIVLILHGAMVAQGYDDCEGDLLQACRDIVGPDVPVGAGLDPHAHLSDLMVEAADILVFYKEWPHIDAYDTYVEAFNLTADVEAGKFDPHISVWDCRMIANYHTLEEPTKSVVDDMKAAEGKDGVISVSFIHGFPDADVPDMGSKMLVITDNQPGKGAELAEEFGRRFFALRGKTGAKHLMELDEGLKAIAKETRFPCIIADYSDMPGGGAAGDATFFLKGLLDLGIDNSIIAALWDPSAVAIALKCDVGDKMAMRIGGKTGPDSGDPLDLDVEIIYKSEDFKMTTENEGESSYGALAVVRAKGIDILLTDKRFPVYDWRLLEQMNLDPRNKKFIVVKSANNFYAGFEPIMGSVLYILSPALCRLPGERPMKRIIRPKWPFDEDPFGSEGK
jgi:microcystin degradation protein MlrC